MVSKSEDQIRADVSKTIKPRKKVQIYFKMIIYLSIIQKL